MIDACISTPTDESAAVRHLRRQDALIARVEALHPPVRQVFAAWRSRIELVGRVGSDGSALGALEAFVADLEAASISLWGTWERERGVSFGHITQGSGV